MKKSEAYHLAQMAVINSPVILPEVKIEVMKVLINDEELALYSEVRKEAEMAVGRN